MTTPWTPVDAAPPGPEKAAPAPPPRGAATAAACPWCLEPVDPAAAAPCAGCEALHHRGCVDGRARCRPCAKAAGPRRALAVAAAVLLVGAGAALGAGLGRGSAARGSAALVAPVAPAPVAPAPVAPAPVAPAPVAPAPQAATSGPLAVWAAADRELVFDPARPVDVVVNLTAAKAAADAPRPPLRLALVVDRSGSMGADGSPTPKIEAARRAVEAFVQGLGPDDACALVAFSHEASLLAPRLREGDRATREAIAALVPQGGTNLRAGLEAGAAALDALDGPGDAPTGAVRRIVLLTDGQDGSSKEALPVVARALAGRGVTVSCHGFGRDVDGALLAATAEAGGGQCLYVDGPDRAVRAFEDELAHVRGTAVRDVQVRLEPAPGVTIEQVVSWQAQADGAARVVRVGDLPGGAERKVVLRVRWTPAAAALPTRREGPAEGSQLPLVRASWSGRLAAGGAAVAGEARADVGYAATAAAAEASVRRALVAQLAEARFADAMASVAKRLEAGDVAGARDAARAARADLASGGDAAAVATRGFVASAAAARFLETGELPDDPTEASAMIPAACLPVGK